MKKAIVMSLVKSYAEKDKPFIVILNNGNQSQPLRFLSEDSEWLIVESISDGFPAAYSYDDINNIFTITAMAQIPTETTDKLPFNNNDLNKSNSDSESAEFWVQEYEKAVKSISYDNLFLADRRNDIKTGVRHTEIAKEWARIDSMFNDAKKNHSLEYKADLIISKLNTLPECTEVKISLGFVFAELKKYDAAAEEFYFGGDYYNAAYCAKLNGDNEYALYCLKCLIKSNGSYDCNILSALFYLLCKYKDGAFWADTFNEINIDNLDSKCVDMVFYGSLALYKELGGVLESLKTTQEDHSVNIDMIIDRIADLSSNDKLNSVQLTSVRPIKERDINVSSDLINNESKDNQGIIVEFTKCDNNGFGFIEVKKSTKIYFNIRQVEDEKLRHLLWNGDLCKVKVNFTYGIGLYGRKAADHIKAIEDLSSLMNICDGFMWNYNNYDKNGTRYGIIDFKGKDCLFRDEAVIDPVLLAYFEHSFSKKNIYVKFVGKKDNSNLVALKVWLDDVKEEDFFNEYSRYVIKEEYNRFLEEKYRLENGISGLCRYEYSPLPIWSDNATTEQLVNTVYHRNEDIISKDEINVSANFGLGINELLAKGTWYLTKEKNLEKAEECFLTVLKRNPTASHINTAVSNLVTIYKQLNRTDDALNILKEYQSYIEQDKYSNHLINIYDKTKQYYDLIRLLNEVIPNAGKSKPHRIKQLITCYIKTNEAQAALTNLKKYKRDIDELSYNNLYFTALDLQGDFTDAEVFLNKCITGTYRVEHKLNYMNKLAVLYQKNGRVGEAIDTYEKWKKLYTSNHSGMTMTTVAVAMSKLEITINRNLCVLYYNSNKIDEAKTLANNLLRKNSEDSIAQRILNGTYISFDNNAVAEIWDDVGEYAEFEGTDDSIPKLLERMLNDINYEKYLFNRNILNRIENMRYIGSESQTEADIDETLKYFENRDLAEQSMVVLVLAKIIKQTVESGRKDNYFTQKRVNLFLGKSLLLKADADIQSSYQNRDCSRYYYFLSLRYLSRSNDDSCFNHAVNMLYHSFFLADNELSDAVKKKEFYAILCIEPPDFQDSIISTKELMICTFDLDIKYSQSRIREERIIRKIINGIFHNRSLLKSFTAYMRELVPDISVDCKNADEYFKAWQKVREKYKQIQNDLQKYINCAAKSIEKPEQLKSNIAKIRNLNSNQILNKTDADYLEDMLDILNKFYEINGLSIIDDLEDSLEKIKESCERMERKICTSPTDLSYENMLGVIIMLKEEALKRKNVLYSESKPNLEVRAEDTAFYKGDYNQAKITIYIENKGNVQKADISNIVLSGKDNNIDIKENPEHTITTVYGNSKDEYIVDISFTNKEKERNLFDVNFSFDYSYYDGSGEQIKEHFSDVYQINLSSINSFMKIENKYTAYAEGAEVKEDEMFFGREKEINSIVESLDQGNGKVLSHRGIYMYGQKRAGKSSIMAHLAKRINEEYPDKYIIIDLKSIGSAVDSKYEVWFKTKILSELEDELDENYHEIYDKINSITNFNDVIRRIEEKPDTNDFEFILSKIEKLIPNRVIMLFVDEFTYIYESIKKKQCSDTFPHFWKALLQNHNICSIVIGQDSMKNFADDYANDFACMKKMFVSYLDEEGAKKLIIDPIKDNEQNRFEEEAVNLIYQLTAGSAYLIMILCSQLVDYMNDKGTSRVTKTTVETFIKNWLFNTAANNNPINDNIFDPQLKDPCFFENSDQVCNDNKIILKYIADKCNLNYQIKITDIKCSAQLSQDTDEYQEKLINQLIKRKVLIKEGEYCRIWIDLLRRYLKTVG